MTDSHAITDDGVTHVCTVHHPKGSSRVLIIEGEEAARGQRVEAESLDLSSRLNASPVG